MEDLKEPVSPTGQFLESDFLNLYIIGVLEFQVPIHNLPIVSLVRDAFHCIPRFTSIMTINDVITGIIFYGIRLYMQDMDYKSRKLKSTAMAIVNTRNVKDYHTVQDMLKTNAKGVWGNHISYMHVSVPKLQDYPISNPLQFVKKAHNSIKRKKNSFATILTEKLLRMEHKLKGSEEVSKNIHRTLRNSSLLISNMVGPMEQMALANHPIKDFFFTLCGLPQSLVVTILSYMGMLRVTLATEEGFIDERKLVWNLNKAFEEIFHEAENV
ncbi:uncharacterized protein LOC107637046 [Arachis ipaensis]|uniref:uncharacterized protein LOC107637046 n=1 Tax=Arachis ipaensis TaxID=130454 RepID=UPI000A2B0DFC|nr:uncharacterized protein LOC107637046 [Arachis ipaensis]